MTHGIGRHKLITEKLWLFLGIRIPHECGRLLTGIDVPGKKTAVSEMHITLLHFEENWPISEIAKALEAAYDIVSKIKPFTVEAKKITCFPSHNGGDSAIVIRVESKELHDMREQLAHEFDQCGIDFSKTFKTYKPHITLSYSEKEIDDFEIDTPIEFSVQEVVLWGGDHGDDRIFITFPLKGPEKQKHSVLLQKTEMFCKMANNPPQDHLTPSYERRKTER